MGMIVGNSHVDVVQNEETPQGERLASSWKLIWIKEGCVNFTVTMNPG